jgi:hypothetical protein
MNFIQRLFLVAVAAVLSACATPRYEIQAPTHGSTVACAATASGSCQVQARVAWQGASFHPVPELWLDGAVVPNALTPATGNVIGNLSMAPGAHTIVVTGLLSDGVSLKTYSATSSFTVSPPPTPVPPTGGFTLTTPSAALLVERTKSVMVPVTISRTGPFAGAVTVTVSGLPAGVTASALTIAAAQTGGTLSLSASAAASFGKTSLTLRGSGGTTGPTATAPLSLTVGRATGAFAEANPAPYASTLPSSRTSRSGTFRVDISTGAPTLPQPRKAVFFRGTQQLGQEIGFTLGPVSTLGGAGFCDDAAAGALTRGVVLSGALPGFSSQNVFTFVDMANPQVLRQVSANMQSSAPSPHVFQPRVFFSADCSVALVASVNTLGPQNHLLQLFDMTTGSPIGTELPFDTPIFSATLQTVGAAQRVEVKVDTGAAGAQVVNRPVP